MKIDINKNNSLSWAKDMLAQGKGVRNTKWLTKTGFIKKINDKLVWFNFVGDIDTWQRYLGIWYKDGWELIEEDS